MSSMKVHLIPIFEDNYVFVLWDEQSQKALVVDPGEADPVADFIAQKNLRLEGILLTHHHADHIGGAQALQSLFQSSVFAPLKNQFQIPFASHYVQEGDVVNSGPFSLRVFELPGHTLGHIAYWNSEFKWLFSGDVLFGLGCGRLFEGSFEQMYQSLQRIKALPQESLIFCTHEYTEINLQFCRMLTRLDDSPIIGDDENLMIYANELHHRRELGLPSVPLKLFIEQKVNPFLLARNLQQFRYLRELRNKQ